MFGLIFLSQRKQKDVQKENDFYIQMLHQALPSDQQNTDKQKGTVSILGYSGYMVLLQ